MAFWFKCNFGFYVLPSFHQDEAPDAARDSEAAECESQRWCGVASGRMVSIRRGRIFTLVVVLSFKLENSSLRNDAVSKFRDSLTKSSIEKDTQVVEVEHWTFSLGSMSIVCAYCNPVSSRPLWRSRKEIQFLISSRSNIHTVFLGSRSILCFNCNLAEVLFSFSCTCIFTCKVEGGPWRSLMEIWSSVHKVKHILG